MRRLTLFFISLLLVTTGCGEIRQKFGRNERGQTSINFSLTNRNSAYTPFYVLPGGIFVYIVGVNGTQFTTNLELDDETQPNSISIPNGSYKVYAVGWVSSGSPNYYPIEGQAYCGFGSSGTVISLTGASTTIPIAMSTADCNFTNASPFANSGQTGSSNFGTLSVQFCEGVANPANCTAPDYSYGGNYLKMSFDIYVKDEGGHHKIKEEEFGCAMINTNTASTAKTIPPGASAVSDPKIFALSFSIHTDSNCSSAPVASFSAPNGMDNAGVIGTVANGFATTSNLSTFYVDL